MAVGLFWPFSIVIVGESDEGSSSIGDCTFHTCHLIPNSESGLATGNQMSHFLTREDRNI